MPQIKNDYYMKIGDIIETSMCPIFIEYSFLPINVSDFHIVLIFTYFNEYYTQIVAFFL